MRPNRPASIAFLSSRAASPKRAWKMEPTRTPALPASCRMWSVPSTVESSGFSIIRCLPARIAASAGSRCSADGVVMHTASRPGCFSSSPTLPVAKPMPCSRAKSCAVDSRRLATPTSAPPVDAATARAWKFAMAPAPMKPKPSLPGISVRQRDRVVAVHRVAGTLVQLHLVEGTHLREQHRRDLVLRIDPEQRARRAVPEEFAHRARGFGGVLRRRDAHREVDAEAHLPLAGQPGLVGDFLRHRIRGHELHSFGLE